MKLTNFDFISNRQLVFILIQISVGTAILSLPRSLAKATRGDSWLPVILGGVAWMIGILIIYQLASRFPQQTLIEYSEEILGSIGGKLISSAYILYSTLTCAIILRLFITVITSFLLPKTPILVTSGLLLLVCYYLSLHKLKILARLDEFLFFILSPSFLVMLPTLTKMNVHNFQPVLQSGIKDILSATSITMFSFIGPEILLIVFPFINRKEQAVKHSAIAITVITATYLYITVVSIGYYGSEAIQYIIWPSINLLKAVEIPFFGRIEFFFIFLWVGVGFTTIASYFYLASFSLKQLVNFQSHRPAGLLILPVIIYIFYLPSNIIQIFNYTDLIALTGTALTFSLPLLMLVIAKLRGIKGATSSD